MSLLCCKCNKTGSLNSPLDFVPTVATWKISWLQITFLACQGQILLLCNPNRESPWSYMQKDRWAHVLSVIFFPPHFFPLLTFRWNYRHETSTGPVASSDVLPEVLFHVTCLLSALAHPECFQYHEGNVFLIQHSLILTNYSPNLLS